VRPTAASCHSRVETLANLSHRFGVAAPPRGQQQVGTPIRGDRQSHRRVDRGGAAGRDAEDVLPARSRAIRHESGVGAQRLEVWGRWCDRDKRVNLRGEPCCAIGDPVKERHFAEWVATRPQDAATPFERRETLVPSLERQERLLNRTVNEQGLAGRDRDGGPVARISENGQLQRPRLVAGWAPVVPAKQPGEILHKTSRIGTAAEAGDESAFQRLTRGSQVDDSASRIESGASSARARRPRSRESRFRIPAPDRGSAPSPGCAIARRAARTRTRGGS